MEIQSTSSMAAMWQLDPTQLNAGAQSGQEAFQGRIGSDNSDITKAGRMANFMSSLSEDDKAEMQAFHEEMIAAVQSGNFDASEMAEKAPDALKEFAEENDIDLEEMLKKGPPPGRPNGMPPSGMGGMYNSAGLGVTTQSEDLTATLLDQFFANEDDESDISALLTDL